MTDPYAALRQALDALDEIVTNARQYEAKAGEAVTWADRGAAALTAARPALEARPEPVAFDHSIGAGRYTAVKGPFWWHIRIGDSTANVGKFHSRLAAEDMALKLLTAFRDGAFEQYRAMLAAAPPAPQTQRPVRLTDERIMELCGQACGSAADAGDLDLQPIHFARAVEAEVLKLNGIDTSAERVESGEGDRHE